MPVQLLSSRLQASALSHARLAFDVEDAAQHQSTYGVAAAPPLTSGRGSAPRNELTSSAPELAAGLLATDCARQVYRDFSAFHW